MTIVTKDRLEPLTGLHIINDVQLDMRKVEQLVRGGTWTKAHLDKYGLAIAEPFVAPEGKRAVGEPSYVEENGEVREVRETEDIPPPPPEPTDIERLEGATGLTVEQIKTVLGIGETKA